MKKRWTGAMTAFCFLFLIGCGAKETDKNVEENREYYDIQVEEKQLFSEVWAENSQLLGSQYLQGEQIQLCAEVEPVSMDGNMPDAGDVYLHKADGNKELLLKEVAYNHLITGDWWMDAQGHYYILLADGIRGLDAEGREIFYNQTGENVNDICQLADGSIMLLLKQAGSAKIAELNSNTGAIDVMDEIVLSEGNQYIGTGQEGLLLLNDEGIWKLDLEAGNKESVMKFAGTTYVWNWDVKVRDFVMLEDGTVEIFREDGRVESLQNVKVSEDRIPLVVRGYYFDNWTKEQITRFNRENTTYYVVLEEGVAETDFDEQSFKERTDMEIAAGRGADIVCSDAVNDAYSLITKGAFEDLGSYMEQSEMKAADYFSLLSGWTREGKTYGVNFVAQVEGVKIQEMFVADEADLAVEDLMDSMLAYKGKAVFIESWNAANVLQYFLCGSEDLWGMIDWEKGTCEFEGELFLKMLETAKKFGDGETNGYPAIAEWRAFDTFYWYDNSEVLETEGNVSIGYFFDEGNYMRAVPDLMAINANSSHKDGAWALVSFLLGEEAQSGISSKNNYTMYFPVDRQVYDTLKTDAVANGTVKDGNIIWTYGSITAEQAEELTREIEEAQVLPMRIEPILTIVLEEAQEYFEDVKSMEEISEVIENRVQLYLDEIK